MWRGGLRALESLRPDQRVHNLPLQYLHLPLIFQKGHFMTGTKKLQMA